jgi:DNA-binding transcriptional LysR family regulator
MELYQARAFVAVAREGSVGAAARRLFRSQPAVTMAVRALERALDARLTERAGRGIRLTAAGETLFHLLDPLLGELEATERRFREALGGRLRGPLRIATDADGILYLLPAAIRAFLKDHADVQVMVAQHEATEAIALVRGGRADVAVCRVLSAPGELEWRRILTTDAVVIAPRRIRLPARPSLSGLARHPLVEGPRSSALAPRVRHALAARGLDAPAALTAENWETVKRYVGLGLGVAVVPGYCLQRHDRRITALPARHLFGRETYGMVTRGASASTAARLFARALERTRFPSGP